MVTAQRSVGKAKNDAVLLGFSEVIIKAGFEFICTRLLFGRSKDYRDFHFPALSAVNLFIEQNLQNFV